MPAYLNIAITLARIFITFTAAMLAGIGIGLAMGLSRVLESALLAIIPLMLLDAHHPDGVLRHDGFGFSDAGGRCRHGGGDAVCGGEHLQAPGRWTSR